MWGVRGYLKLFQRDTYSSSLLIKGVQCEYIYCAENANQLVRIIFECKYHIKCIGVLSILFYLLFKNLCRTSKTYWQF